MQPPPDQKMHRWTGLFHLREAGSLAQKQLEGTQISILMS